MGSQKLAVQFKLFLAASAVSALCLLSACATTDSSAGTVELTAQIGDFPSQPMAQGTADGLQPEPLAMPAEVFAAGIGQIPDGTQGLPSDKGSQAQPPSSVVDPANPGQANPGQAKPEPAQFPAQGLPQNSAAQNSAAVDSPAQILIEPGAATAVENLSSEQDRTVASRALGLIQYDWQNSLKGWELRFLGARSGYRGMTYPTDRVIEVYLRQGDTAQSLAHVVAHELGHAVDLTFFDDGDRRAWMQARKFGSSVPWFVSPGGADFSSGSGDFAESFAWWQVGPPDWFGELAPPPTQDQLVVLLNLVVLPGIVR
ncbi:MAG: hypothetical protein WD029_08035 [Microthrixaceae bacterium]